MLAASRTPRTPRTPRGSQYVDIEKYRTPKDQARVAQENEKSERIKQTLYNNLKLKTLYDFQGALGSIGEAFFDKKIEKKTYIQKAEDLAKDQLTATPPVNSKILNEKINEIISSVNICCKGINIDKILLQTDDFETLVNRNLEMIHAAKQ